jgi:hypothetical protein
MQGLRRSQILSSWRWHLVLALVVLLGQQAGLRHSLQHALRDEGAPTHAACIECLAHHASDHVVSHTQPPLALLAIEHVWTDVTGQAQCIPQTEAGYLSRAPPVLSA